MSGRGTVSAKSKVRADAPVVEVLIRNQQQFLRFLEARVRDRELARDLLQAALAKSVEKASAVQSAESAVAWFYRILRNALVDLHRRRLSEARALERETVEAAALDVAEPELHKAVCRCVGALAVTLKDEYATVLRRVDVEEEPLSAVASDEGITVNNASVRLHRARAALRKRVREMCGACAEHGCLDCSCKRAEVRKPE